MIKFLKKSDSTNYQKTSYSQSGEDLILDYWINSSAGFYVDVGANHPVMLNNTYLFYKKGWRGINIEPNPDIFKLLNAVRPNDVNLNMGISKTNISQTFYSINPPTMSTFSKNKAIKFQKNGYNLLSTQKIKCLSLKSLLKRYLPKDTPLDILNIDVEGTEDLVIMSNDWNKYRPKFLILETVNHLPTYKINKKYDYLMKSYYYHKFADTYINTIYISDEYMNYKQLKI
ncbi:MAG: hypothetical protein Fur0011_5950 [Candidatus Microgenomates bacterium]